jgi:CubicO group peptidase (beta-lactamase class C family)
MRTSSFVKSEVLPRSQAFCSWCVLLLLASCVQEAQADSATTAQLLPVEQSYKPRTVLREELEAIRQTGDIVGVSAEVRSRRGVYRAHAGSNDPRGGSSLSQRALFRIASVTKTFTAVIVLQLVEESKLALSDTVERWLPAVVSSHGNDGSKITIAQLLRHESGLSNYLEDPTFSDLVASAQAFDAHRFDAISQAELVSVAMQSPPLFAPGAHFAYSNTNYVLLGMIIQAATAQTWREQIEHRIVAPLGLTNTYVPGYSPYLIAPHVRGYARFPDREGLVDVTNNSLISAADAGVVSSLSDLNRFFEALVTGELLSSASLSAMQDTIAIDHPMFPNGRYGLGLQWSPLSCGGGYWHHTGDTLGYAVWTGVLGDGSRSVTMMMNSPGEEETAAAATALIDRVLCADDRVASAP